MREVLTPHPVGVVCSVLKTQNNKSSQATIEDPVCFSSSLRNTTDEDAIAP